MAVAPPAISDSLHANQRQLAQLDGTVICRNHRTVRSAGQPHQRSTTREGAIGIYRPKERQSKTVCLDRKRQSDTWKGPEILSTDFKLRTLGQKHRSRFVTKRNRLVSTSIAVLSIGRLLLVPGAETMGQGLQMRATGHHRRTQHNAATPEYHCRFSEKPRCLTLES